MSENINNDDLNEVFEEEMDDADVITVPIDETLSNSGEAADAAAVGAALALKADKDELPATIKVNGQQADNQGLILINGSHIPVDGSTQKTLAEAVSEVSDMTAETIPMSGETGAATIAAEIEDIKEDVSDLQEAIDGMEEKTADNILMETGSTTTVKNAIETLDRKAVKSVNRKLPDAAGDVDLSVVPLAENLQSDKLQSIEGEFIIRTTGGNGAVADGKAYPQHIYGNCQHNGYVEEVLNMTVIPITRTEPDEPITATLDRDTFIAAVTESSTINLYYTTEWSEDPADYGVTVTGDPVAGDQITIVYVKEQRGTILVADPDRLVGTGWNLFNANEGYARVVKYSDVYGYKIGGTYTSIAFSATLTGDRTSLLPNANGLFSVPSDGYVFVTGGNTTDTYILATWSDWTNGPSTGYWEAYRESGIDLSAVVETYFPYGMLKIGSVRDEIDLVAKRSISRIERMVYSEENRAAAAASGRAYDFDESNIYLVRAEYVQNAITISTEYSVSEHGLEWFTETVLPLDTEILYGKNLRDKLERDVLTISAQTLTEEEKAQARTNIGAMSQAEGDTKLVAPTVAGTTGQLLHLKADGGTEWTDSGTPTDEQVGTAVSAWLEAHPEATTTVEDGAISYAKLNSELKGIADDVPDLKSAFDNTNSYINKTRQYNLLDNCYIHYVYEAKGLYDGPGVDVSNKCALGITGLQGGDKIYVYVPKAVIMYKSHSFSDDSYITVPDSTGTRENDANDVRTTPTEVKEFGGAESKNNYVLYEYIVPNGKDNIGIFFNISEINDVCEYYINSPIENRNVIDCWGDSLTMSENDRNKTYPEMLQEFLDYQVNNYGDGGEVVCEIAGRQGGVPLLVNQDFTIGANKNDYVTITLKTSFNGYVLGTSSMKNFLYQRNSGINPVNIGGVIGNLVCNTQNVITFVRSIAGSQETIKANEPVFTRWGINHTENHAQIIFVGQNNGTSYSTKEELSEYIDSMIRYYNHNRYLVLTHPYDADVSVTIERETYFKRKYGNKCFAVREYFVNHGIEKAIEYGFISQPTAEDLSDIAQGRVPSSLRATNDVVHFNYYGYYILAKRVAELVEYNILI